MRKHALGWVAALATVGSLLAPASEAQSRFQRGDVDQNGAEEITDAIAILGFLFVGTETPRCLESADIDDNGALELTDGVRLLLFLFSGAEAPPAPFRECGEDPSSDTLGCAEFPACETEDEFHAFVASFGVLETLAGAGGGDLDNEWLLSFEGGRAVDAELSRPHNALGDDAGNVYIVDKEAHGVRKVSPEGTITTVAGTNVAGDGDDDPGPGTERALSNPNGLWVRGDGTVYILDLDNGKVRRLASDGTLSTFFAIPGLVVGRGLWVADDESVAYASSGSTLVRWTPQGGLTLFSSGFVTLANIFVEPDGNILVTDIDAHLVYRVFADSGEREVIAGNGLTFGGGDGSPALETGLEEVRGVWRLETGAILLATHQGSQVWFLDTGGIIHLLVDGARSDGTHGGDGELLSTPGLKVSEVRSVTLTPQGHILLTENDRGFVRIVYRAGSVGG